MKKVAKVVLAILLLGVLAGVGLWGYIELSWPSRADAEEVLREGVTYRRVYRTEPRRQMIHIVEIDRAELRVLGTDVDFVPSTGQGEGSSEFVAETTSHFAEAQGVDLAVNASFFHPSWTEHPFSFFPKEGEVTGVLGRVIHDEIAYGDVHSRRAVFCVSRSGRLRVVDARCLPGTVESVPGGEVLLRDGELDPRLVESPDPYALVAHPRTAIALSEDEETIWLVVVDGRQPTFSEGMTLHELAEFLKSLGAHNALNLDGGGSSTLVARRERGVEVLNSPIHTRIPGRERPVPVSLGIRFEPRQALARR